ncbi:MAG: short-chain dehydrogenase [Gammaproteobacteria bacterium]|nr:MAG: short-chain dehydrogenase [Gammaproteobacteria bacterium]
MNVKDKVVVITGGGKGIGRALALRFHADGAAKVAVADLDVEAAQAVAKQVDGLAFACDVRKEQDIVDMVDAVQSQCGAIDLFCSNAGIIAGDGEQGWASSAPNEVWQAMWEIHVMSHVWAARACLPKMLERGSGYFLNTVSAAGLLNQVGDTAYSTTKHAALGFAEALSITHGADGIGVSALCPQAVATDLISAVPDGGSAGLDGVLTPEEVADTVVQGLVEESFLILPHPTVEQYRAAKAADYERWLGGMRKLHRQFATAVNAKLN